MFKYFILFINSLVLFFYNLFVADPVNVNMKFPESVKPGSDFVAELIIKKGSVSGFAKLQVSLPDGFSAKEIESKGGTFTFENHIVKLIWTALPSENEINVRFNVAVDANSNGNKQIFGKFAYIINNVKQQLDLDSITVRVENTAPTVTSVTSPTATVNPIDTAKTKTTVAAVIDTAKTSVANAANDNVKAAGTEQATAVEGIACTRKIITETAAGHYKVQVTIAKQNIKGFAKLLETIPANAKATAIKTNGASFSVLDNAAKFVWVSLPKDEVLQLEYQLIYSQAMEGNQKITGDFSYLENDQSKKSKVKGQELFNPNAPVEAVPAMVTATPEVKTPAATETVAKEEPKNTSDVQKTTSTEPSPIAQKKEEVQVADKSVVTADKVAETTTSDPVNKVQTEPVAESKFAGAAEVKKGNVNYGVQIGAYKTAYKTDYYVKKYGITETIRTDLHEGYTKCIIGNFDEYKNARDSRETYREKGIKGAFVTAYNSGKRVTVQEALMISNQKWFR